MLTLETQTLARACGKSHVHNLEPEDLVALTVEAAAMARVPLAGTDWIPGQGELMRLYDSGVSGNCYKVRLLLAHLGLEYERYELDVVDRSNRKDVLGELNPGLRVPTLVLDDGRALGESGAILWYLADGTEYVPADPFDRAKVLQWMFFEQYCARAVRRGAPASGSRRASTSTRRRSRSGSASATSRFDAMESHVAGHEFLAGGAYSIADIALYAYTHVADEGGFDLSGYPGDPGVARPRRGAAGPRPDHGLKRTCRPRPGARPRTRPRPAVVAGPTLTGRPRGAHHGARRTSQAGRTLRPGHVRSCRTWPPGTVGESVTAGIDGRGASLARIFDQRSNAG